MNIRLAYTLLLAALLAFGGEVIFWARGVYTPLDIGAALGYLALARLLLDLTDRYRVRNIFGALPLAGVGGLIALIVLDPRPSSDLFLALASRGLGGWMLVTLGAGALLMWCTGRGPGLTVPVALAVIGVVWGIWARWSPTILSGAGEPPLPVILLTGGVFALVVLAASIVASRTPAPEAVRWRMSPAEMLAVAVGLVAAFLTSGGSADDAALAAGALVLVGVSLFILWAERRSKPGAYIEALGRVRPRWPMLVLGLAALAVTGIVGYSLPRGSGASDPAALIGSVLTAAGLVWLPTVALVLGWRALQREIRAMRL